MVQNDLLYYTTDILHKEIPSEVSLCISIAGCSIGCTECNSKWLWLDKGEPLTGNVIDSLLEKHPYVTCVCLLGESDNWVWVNFLNAYIKEKHGKKTALYTGHSLPEALRFLNIRFLDYLKVGSYIKGLGGLDSKTTNQRLYSIDFVECQRKEKREEVVFTDITYKLNQIKIKQNED